MATWSRENVLTFIELYKSFKCLWKIKSKEYGNRSLKDKAYDKLVKFVHRFDKTANRETITKKINALRTNFRKELKKVENSKTTGASKEEVYVPKLWYYKELLFLVDLELPQSSTSNIDMRCQTLTLPCPAHIGDIIKVETPDKETRASSTITVVSESREGCFASEKVETDHTRELYCVAKREITEMDNRINEDVEGDQNIESHGMEISLVSSSSGDINSQTLISPSTSRTSAPVPSPNESTNATKRKAGDELLTLAHDRLKMPNEDEHDAFAKTVAFKLRRLNRVQCFFAEKLINDVLYEAGLGELSRMSYIGARPETAPFTQYVASGHDEV